MNSTDFFTRRALGMDYRIWASMVLVCIASLALYSFSHTGIARSNNSNCLLDTVQVNGKKAEIIVTCYLDQSSTFEFPKKNTSTVVWDFDDGTKRENGAFVSHKFTLDGTYMVTAIVNGTCKYTVEIEVVYDPFTSDDQSTPVIEIYADPINPTVGKEVKFYCVSDLRAIDSYQWTNSGTGEVKTDASPNFTFPKEGMYTIELVINKGKYPPTKSILNVKNGIPQPGLNLPGTASGLEAPVSIGRLVSPGPNPFDSLGLSHPKEVNKTNSPSDSLKKAVERKAPELDPESFKGILQGVVDQNGKELDDLYKYLDYESATRVELNENGAFMPLKDFCNIMRKKKPGKRKIESVSFVKDNKNSIQTIKVKMVKNEGFFSRLNPFK
ncbi:MAG: PKD domain-containing protein [Chitinophagaceae bacterium]